MSLEGLASPSEHSRGFQQRQRCSSPDTIAQAFLGIGQMSTGKLVSISIFGGPDAGWLAAIAE
jgi:hypothetical protein